MKITIMCAVPFQRLDGGPGCVDGRGGQIYHNATPGFFVEHLSGFYVGVAVSFLLEYEHNENAVSHLDYVVGTASMNGEVIGTTRNDFVLKPFAPRDVNSAARRLATYENIPISISCSGQDYGLIELSWALKVDTVAEPVAACQTSHVRSFTLDSDDRLSPDQYDKWQVEEISRRAIESGRKEPSRWKRFLRVGSRYNFSARAPR